MVPKVKSLLHEDGVAVLHTIGRPRPGVVLPALYWIVGGHGAEVGRTEAP